MQKETKIKIAKIILGIVAAAGVLSIAVLAPNALQALDMFYGKNKRKYNTKYYLKKKITKLKENGLIKFQTERGKTFVRLTEKGSKQLMKYQLKEKVIEKPKHWDQKWRVIIFDIKEYKKAIRDALRNELTNLGFLKLQNSVWVHPYDCEEVIIMLKAYFHLGKDVLYMTVDQIENDKWLKQKFNLH